MVDELQPYLQLVGDMERILARVALRSARPRDLTRLRTALEQIPALRTIVQQKHRHFNRTFQPNCRFQRAM